MQPLDRRRRIVEPAVDRIFAGRALICEIPGAPVKFGFAAIIIADQGAVDAAGRGNFGHGPAPVSPAGEDFGRGGQNLVPGGFAVPASRHNASPKFKQLFKIAD
ncbi:hypothetical protein SDC9_149824 [bioreactor metagenome]|uniref:Uncharacterized protein n=1 Tax=bioreactor metagenome TaxID=1076179 RepID=A0A645EKS7_9ZZZZ